jgi:uncharacterized protein YecE (DUF72 family)
MGRLRYGTSSWSEKAWVGPFYPPGTRPADFLTHYATQFDTVEADVTYYRVPDTRLAAGWARKVPPGFRLAAKFPRSVVHCGAGPHPDGERVLVPEFVNADRDAFLAGMALLGERCGPLVLQFPYFNRRAFPAGGVFLERLDAFLGGLPPDFRYAVEVRNERWIGPPLLEVLRRHRAALVLVALPYMPHPERLARSLDLFTTDFNYVRLIGDRKATEAAAERFDRVVLDKRAELLRWAEFLRPAVARAAETFAYANNHFAGYGPGTIRELAEMVRGGPREA